MFCDTHNTNQFEMPLNDVCVPHNILMAWNPDKNSFKLGLLGVGSKTQNDSEKQVRCFEGLATKLLVVDEMGVIHVYCAY